MKLLTVGSIYDVSTENEGIFRNLPLKGLMENKTCTEITKIRDIKIVIHAVYKRCTKCVSSWFENQPLRE